MKLPITRCPQLLYSLSHFECDGQTVHMLTQWHLLPPLTSTVKSSLFTHVHSSPLSLVARLHQSCTDHSSYINNGWNFSGQTSYIHTKIHIQIFIIGVLGAAGFGNNPNVHSQVNGKLIVIYANHGIIINKLWMHTTNWMILNYAERNQTKNEYVLYNSTYILHFQKLQAKLH